MTPKQIRALVKKWPHTLGALAAEIPCHERSIYKWLDGSRKPLPGMAKRLQDVVETVAKK